MDFVAGALRWFGEVDPDGASSIMYNADEPHHRRCRIESRRKRFGRLNTRFTLDALRQLGGSHVHDSRLSPGIGHAYDVFGDAAGMGALKVVFASDTNRDG
jgi:hypothetical protein